MLISNCPLRVSLFGGSTDNPFFVEKYGHGSVINFTSNLKTYITLHQDQLGYNAESSKYIVNYISFNPRHNLFAMDILARRSSKFIRYDLYGRRCKEYSS